MYVALAKTLVLAPAIKAVPKVASVTNPALTVNPFSKLGVPDRTTNPIEDIEDPAVNPKAVNSAAVYNCCVLLPP